MSYEIRDEHRPHLTPAERRALTYEKEPVENLAELWEKYPEGGYPGWYCLIKNKHALYGWDEHADQWTELGQGLLADKHDKKAGLLLRFLPAGAYSEKNGVIPGEIAIVPLSGGNYTFYNTKYPRNRQTLTISTDEIGQITLVADPSGQWQTLTLPIYDYIRDQLAAHTHNRGIVLQNPATVHFIPPAKNNDYVYFKDTADTAPILWIYNGQWNKTATPMPSAETAPLSEYARHGYQQTAKIKTLAQLEDEITNLEDDLHALTDNVDGGNAFSQYGGCRGINGGDAFTNYQ